MIKNTASPKNTLTPERILQLAGKTVDSRLVGEHCVPAFARVPLRHLFDYAVAALRIRPIVFILLSFTCTALYALPLSQEKASLLSKAYIAAQLDDRDLAYQLALAKLKIAQSFDAELTKARPSASLNQTHPIWKTARANLLQTFSTRIESLLTKEKMQQADQGEIAKSLTDVEADALLAFINSSEGRSYFQAVRLFSTRRAIEGYALLAALNRAGLPESISPITVQTDLKQVSEEVKSFSKPDKQTVEKINAFLATDAWEKLQHATTLASLKQIFADGQLKGDQGFLHRVVAQAIEEFKHSQTAQGQ